MNIYSIAGLFLIFVGSMLATYGSMLSNRIQNERTGREFSDQLKEFRSDIETEKEKTSTKEERNAVEKTEDQFNIWANKFIDSKAELSISQKKRVLSHEEEQIKQTKFWRKYILYLNNTLIGLINAINEKPQQAIQFHEFNIPNNLYDWKVNDNYFEIQFKEDLFWLFNYTLFLDDNRLWVTISINKQSVSAFEPNLRGISYLNRELDITFSTDSGEIQVSTSSPIFSSPELKKTYDLKNYESAIKIIAEKLFESQLLAL